MKLLAAWWHLKIQADFRVGFDNLLGQYIQSSKAWVNSVGASNERPSPFKAGLSKGYPFQDWAKTRNEFVPLSPAPRGLQGAL